MHIIKRLLETAGINCNDVLNNLEEVLCCKCEMTSIKEGFETYQFCPFCGVKLGKRLVEYREPRCSG